MNPLLLAGIVAGAPIVAQGSWWTALGAVALPRHELAPAAGNAHPGKLIILVPAHNEEQMLPATLVSLQIAADGRDAEIVVIADNCTDATAAVARSAGVTVFERQSETERGKNFALDFAIGALAARGSAPAAVAVVDADTLVSPNFVDEVLEAIGTGASALQTHYRAPASEQPLGRLRRLALGLAHWTRPLAAQRLAAGTTLKGNGMAFAWDVASNGIGGHGITEDAAFTLALARRGVRVQFVPGAWVEGFMATDYESARVQDARWEQGRLALMREALSTVCQRVAAGDLRTAIAAAEVGSLPLTLAIAGATALGVLVVAGGGGMLAIVPLAAVGTGVAMGIVASRPDPADLSALIHAPRFITYKLSVFARLAVSRGANKTWVRTARQ